MAKDTFEFSIMIFLHTIPYNLSYFCRLLIFFNVTFLQNILLKNNSSVPNSLDPDKATCFVRPDLVKTDCKDHENTTKIGASRKESKIFSYVFSKCIEQIHHF